MSTPERVRNGACRQTMRESIPYPRFQPVSTTSPLWLHGTCHYGGRDPNSVCFDASDGEGELGGTVPVDIRLGEQAAGVARAVVVKRPISLWSSRERPLAYRRGSVIAIRYRAATVTERTFTTGSYRTWPEFWRKLEICFPMIVTGLSTTPWER